jgi:hypothetical protein
MYTFTPKEGEPPLDLRHVVRGPDGATYVIETTRQAVYRIDLKERTASAIFRAGDNKAGATVSIPKLLAVGGRDLLMLDSKNVMWRWRAADNEGKGTVTRVRIAGATDWGDDILAIGTFVRLASEGLYNLYVVDQSEEQILAYSPSRDGSGFPARPADWLATTRDIRSMRSLHIDGDLFTVEDGTIMRFVSGKSDGWEPTGPGDTLLRPEPVISVLTGRGDRRAGSVYGYDRRNNRIIELDKAEGAFRAQYRLAGNIDGWEDIRGMYIAPPEEAEAPTVLVWISRDSVHQVVLEPVEDVAPPSPSPSSSASPEASAAPSAQP